MKSSGPPARRKPLKPGKGLARGKGLGRGAGLARGSGPAPVSPKRADEHDERDAVRHATFTRDRWRCVASEFVPGAPCPPGLECDERQGRGRRPGSHLDLAQTQSLCWADHRLKTTEPRLAGLLGLNGLEEQARWLDDEPDEHAALVGAVAEWARRKAILLGGPPAGGDVDAVIRLRDDRASGARA